MRKMRDITCFDVADYLLTLVDEDEGDSMTNLKLQKLVYYAQGLHLACYDAPLFDEAIEAWTHGPVVPELYQKYRDLGYAPIAIPQDIDFDKFDIDTKEFLDDVYSVFGQYSAWKLREMTHKEPPWSEAYSTGSNTVISHKALKEYFSHFVEEE